MPRAPVCPSVKLDNYIVKCRTSDQKMRLFTTLKTRFHKNINAITQEMYWKHYHFCTSTLLKGHALTQEQELTVQSEIDFLNNFPIAPEMSDDEEEENLEDLL